jgi:hypothetical protein
MCPKEKKVYTSIFNFFLTNYFHSSNLRLWEENYSHLFIHPFIGSTNGGLRTHNIYRLDIHDPGKERFIVILIVEMA